jgi:hypothetical protein
LFLANKIWSNNDNNQRKKLNQHQEINQKEIERQCAKLFLDPNDVDLNYDFKSTIDFLRAINKNGIIKISENIFSSTIISRTSLTSLPMFEDTSRFFATLLASGVSGNRVFSTYWLKLERKHSMYDKLVYLANLHLTRAK